MDFRNIIRKEKIKSKKDLSSYYLKGNNKDNLDRSMIKNINLRKKVHSQLLFVTKMIRNKYISQEGKYVSIWSVDIETNQRMRIWKLSNKKTNSDLIQIRSLKRQLFFERQQNDLLNKKDGENWIDYFLLVAQYIQEEVFHCVY